MKSLRFSGVAALVVFAAIGVLVASNMAFRYTYGLRSAGSPVSEVVSLTGTNDFALPYKPKGCLGTASDLIRDIDSFGSSGDTAEVSRFIEATDSLETYTGRKGTPDPDFPLEAGQGLFVKMNGDVNYTISGTHMPGLEVSLDIPGAGSATGTNFLAMPYHPVATTAKELMDDIGFANVAEVSRFIQSSDAFETYTGRKGTPDPDFSLRTARPVFVKMQGSQVPYVPSHY